MGFSIFGLPEALRFLEVSDVSPVFSSEFFISFEQGDPGKYSLLGVNTNGLTCIVIG